MSCICYGRGHDWGGTPQLLLAFALQEIKIALASAWFSGQLGYFSEGPRLGSQGSLEGLIWPFLPVESTACKVVLDYSARLELWVYVSLHYAIFHVHS